MQNKIQLNPQGTFLTDLKDCGPMISRTNNQAVHQKSRGIYMNAAFHGPTGIVRGPGVDLRLWPAHWDKIEVIPPQGPVNHWLIQIHDSHDCLIHEIQTTEQSRIPEFEHMLKEHALTTQSHSPKASPAPPIPLKAPGAEEAKALLYRWSNLRNTHEFAPMLRELGLHRLSAIQAVIGDFARKVEKRSARLLFQEVKKIGLPIMVFSGNSGCLQIFTGKVQEWSLEDQTLTLGSGDHEILIQETQISFSYVVRKPTTEGLVSSLELFDAQGDLIAQIFSARNPKSRESEEWRNLLLQLPDEAYEEFLCD